MSLRGVIAFGLLLAALVFSQRFLTRPQEASSMQVPAPRPVKGYYLRDVVLEQSDSDGKLLYLIRASKIEQLPKRDRIQLSMVRISYPGDEPDQGWDLSADKGEISADGTNIILRENVRAIERGENAMRLIRTDELVFDPATSIARTDAEVIVELDGYQLSATGMVADSKTNKLELQSTINARFEP